MKPTLALAGVLLALAAADPASAGRRRDPTRTAMIGAMPTATCWWWAVARPASWRR